MFVVGNVEVSRVLLDSWIAERRLGNPQLIVGKVCVPNELVYVACVLSAPLPHSITQRLTHQAVLLHKGLSVYPLVDFRTYIVQP